MRGFGWVVSGLLLSFLLLQGLPARADQTDRNQTVTGSSATRGFSLFGGGSKVKTNKLTPPVLRSVQLSTVITAGARPVTGNVTYLLEGLGGLKTSKEVVATKGKAKRISLPEGRYRLQTSYDATTVEEEIAVDAGTQKYVVNLGAGEVNLRMIPAIGAKALKNGLVWTVMTYGKDANGKRRVLHQSGESAPRMVLPAGWYMVHAMNRERLVKHVIEVGEGQTYNYTLLRQ
tara:strand:+ start:8216 stop:8908 length:693 start_codon:yes stop_codon:yes gene_type:complete